MAAPCPPLRFSVGDLVVVEPTEWRDAELANPLTRGVGQGDVGRVTGAYDEAAWRTIAARSRRAPPMNGYVVEHRRGATTESTHADATRVRAPMDRAAAEVALARLRAPATETAASLAAAGIYDEDARVTRAVTQSEAIGLLRYWYELPADAWNEAMRNRLRRYERLFLRELEEVLGLPYESLRAEMRATANPLATWEAGMDARGTSRVKAALAAGKKKRKVTPLP